MAKSLHSSPNRLPLPDITKLADCPPIRFAREVLLGLDDVTSEYIQAEEIFYSSIREKVLVKHFRQYIAVYPNGEVCVATFIL